MFQACIPVVVFINTCLSLIGWFVRTDRKTIEVVDCDDESIKITLKMVEQKKNLLEIMGSERATERKEARKRLPLRISVAAPTKDYCLVAPLYHLNT